VIPNFIIAECFINRLSACDEIALSSIEVKDGWIELPTKPGLGIDIDVDRLRKHPYQKYDPRGLRHYWQEFPRKHYAIPSRLQGAAGIEKEPGPKTPVGE
jgi:galactonate dehydratase